MTAYGGDDIRTLVDYFKEALEVANVDVGLCELEWTKLKSHLFSRYMHDMYISNLKFL